MDVLAIIPARGGSQGILKKNIRKLYGKPLIEYSIISAQKSNRVTRIIVSTDDSDIAKISRSLDADVPFLRPKKYAKKNSLTIDVVKHTLNFLETTESFIPDIITILQPTSPFRTPSLLDLSIDLLIKTKATSVISVSHVKDHPNISFSYQNKFLKPYAQDFENHSIRQKRSPLYSPTGSIYTFWYNTIKKYNSIYGPKIKPIIIQDAKLNVDIDEKFHFFMAEMILRYWDTFVLPK
jgi:CMP-N-acetylneuraminic acid synthetase